MTAARKPPKGSPTFQRRDVVLERIGAPVAYRPLTHWLGTQEYTLALYHLDCGRWHVADPDSGRGMAVVGSADTTVRQAIVLARQALNDLVAKHGESKVLNTIDAAQRQAAQARADEGYAARLYRAGACRGGAQVAAEEARIAELEAEGMTRSDAQAVLEAEQLA
jgi:hypothetical protein